MKRIVTIYAPTSFYATSVFVMTFLHRYSGNKTEVCASWDFDHTDYRRTAVEKV